MSILEICLIAAIAVLSVLCARACSLRRLYEKKYKYWKRLYRKLNDEYVKLWHEDCADANIKCCGFCEHRQAEKTTDGEYIVICGLTGETRYGYEYCDNFSNKNNKEL